MCQVTCTSMATSIMSAAVSRVQAHFVVCSCFSGYTHTCVHTHLRTHTHIFIESNCLHIQGSIGPCRLHVVLEQASIINFRSQLWFSYLYIYIYTHPIHIFAQGVTSLSHGNGLVCINVAYLWSICTRENATQNVLLYTCS